MARAKSTKPTVMELFAGAGGLLSGLEMAGFKTVVANEVHHDPCKTLRHNFPGLPVIEGSIRQIEASALLDAAGLRKGEIDLIAGGPPCQGFSTAGLKDRADPRNTLIGDYIRIVKDVQPRAFLLENVTGLTTMYGGKLFDRILDQLDELGYKFHFKIVFAADYGVPQKRRRLIVLGAREDTPPEFPYPTHSPWGEPKLFSDELPTYVTVGDALGDLPNIGSGEIATKYRKQPSSPYQREMREGATIITNHEASRHKVETMAYYGLIPPGGTALDIPIDLRNRKQGVQRWPLNGLSRTITTEPTDFLHPTLNRIPTVRELARVQSFPDWFEFKGQRTTGNKMRRLGYCSQTQQVGNAVPPVLARAIGIGLKSWLGEDR
jgi:DNA (cytosine-5)-methyltransferase 1